MRKSFVRNTILISGLILSLILSAQINQNNQKGRNFAADSTQTASDTSVQIDNKEGLQELSKIIERYQTNNLLLSGEIYYYDDIDSSKISDQKSVFKTVITPKAISYELDSVQTISQEGLTMIVDNKEKSISVFDNEENYKNSTDNNIADQIKEFVNYIKSIEVKKQNDSKTLVIHFNDDFPSNINLYQILYDSETFRVKKIRVEIADGEITDSQDASADDPNKKDFNELVLVDSSNSEISTGYYAKLKTSAYEIVYRNERFANETMIDLKKFIKKSKEGYEAVGAYKGYEFQN